jgi:hypothetical protein
MSPGARSIGLGLIVAGLTLATAALADTTTVKDKRNTRYNLFDIKSVTAGHKAGLLQYTIRTYPSWRSNELVSTKAKPRDICVYIWRAKSDPKEQQDYQVCAYFEDGKLKGSVFHVRPPKKRTGKVFVRRTDSHGVIYRFEKGAIGNPRRYQWQVVTGYTGRGCPRDPPFQFGCDDSAPTGNVKVHDLGPPGPPSARHEK